MEDISGEEVRTGLRKKKGKEKPDDIPVEAWIALGNKGVEFLVYFFNRLLRGEKIPDKWRRSVLIPLYKDKGRHQIMWKLPGNQVNEPHYETVGKGSRSKNKESDDCLATIWVHTRKE